MEERKSLIATMANAVHMEPAAFAKTIKATVMPAKHTDEQLAAFLVVAHKYDLDPITREIHAFPTKAGGVQPVVGIDGWVKQAQRHPQYDGVEFAADLDEAGKVSAITCRVYRKDQGHPTEVTEYLSECARNTEPWKQWPVRMLRHKAMIQAIRYAFGISGLMDEDEAVLIESSFSNPAETIKKYEAPKKSEPQQSANPWPKWDRNVNKWYDIDGVEFDPKVHVSADKEPWQPPCNLDGTFRARRGKAKEAQALNEAARKQANTQSSARTHTGTQSVSVGSTNQRPTDPGPGFQNLPGESPELTLNDVLTNIAAAETMDELNAAEDLKRNLPPADQTIIDDALSTKYRQMTGS